MRNFWLFAAAAGLAAWAAAGVGGPLLTAVDGLPCGGEGSADALPIVQARKADKLRSVRALLAGDCTLLGAAARFRELDAVEPRVRADVHSELYAGATEAEGYCRAVIWWARHVDSPEPGEAAETAARRLEAELDGHLRGGTLGLPPPADPGRSR